MAYEKLNLPNGIILKAEHVNHIEDGIAAVEKTVESSKAEIIQEVLTELGAGVIGYVDGNNNIVVKGSLAYGTYSVRYEMEDGSIAEIGDLILSEDVYYSVTKNLTNCTINNTAWQITPGDSYSAIISANSGYNISSVKVTMGGIDITSTAYSNGVITIGSVTGNVVITAVAVKEAAKTYTITNSLTNCANSNGMTVVEEGSAYSATITANEGYKLDSISVMMGGYVVTATDGIINIASVTGDIVITAVASVNTTNWIPISTLADGDTKTIENGIVYSTRLGTSDGGYRDATGIQTSGFIPVKLGDIVYMSNIGTIGNNGTNEYICFYKSDYSKLVNGVELKAIMDTQEDNMYVGAITTANLSTLTSDIAYIRICSSALTTSTVLQIKRDGKWL